MPTISPDLACRLLDAAIVAYDIEGTNVPSTSTYYQHIRIKSGTEPVAFVDGPEQINAGFVAQTEDDWILVVFRGTLPPFKGHLWSWVSDWLNDFRAGPMPWSVAGKDFGQVETGFGKATQDLWPFVEAALAKLDVTAARGIMVTGHSKGGGMTFPAATLVKAAYPEALVKAVGFAAPLTCDRAFAGAYEKLGLLPYTVRYQNQYDIVPFLPYYPHLPWFAAAERMMTGGKNEAITTSQWVDNDYVQVGTLRYLGDNCVVQSGGPGQDAADHALWQALEHLRFDEIAEAHSATGRYHSCVCNR